MFSSHIAAAVAVLLLVVTVASTATAIGADPTPAASGLLIDPLDPRAGSGASRVGSPLLALLIVTGIGVAAAVATAVYVRVVRAR